MSASVAASSETTDNNRSAAALCCAAVTLPEVLAAWYPLLQQYSYDSVVSNIYHARMYERRMSTVESSKVLPD